MPVQPMLTSFSSALTTEDVAAIDAAGIIGSRRITARTYLRRAAIAALVGAAVLGVCSYSGISVL